MFHSLIMHRMAVKQIVHKAIMKIVKIFAFMWDHSDREFKLVMLVFSLISEIRLHTSFYWNLESVYCSWLVQNFSFRRLFDNIHKSYVSDLYCEQDEQNLRPKFLFLHGPKQSLYKFIIGNIKRLYEIYVYEHKRIFGVWFTIHI